MRPFPELHAVDPAPCLVASASGAVLAAAVTAWGGEGLGGYGVAVGVAVALVAPLLWTWTHVAPPAGPTETRPLLVLVSALVAASVAVIVRRWLGLGDVASAALQVGLATWAVLGAPRLFRRAAAHPR